MTGLAFCTLKRRARASARPYYIPGLSSHKLGRAFALASQPMNAFIGWLVRARAMTMSADLATQRPGRNHRPGRRPEKMAALIQAGAGAT